jgi:hypothetical protein
VEGDPESSATEFLAREHQRLVDLVGAIRFGWDQYLASEESLSLDHGARDLLVRILDAHLSRTSESAIALQAIVEKVDAGELDERSLLALALWT